MPALVLHRAKSRPPSQKRDQSFRNSSRATKTSKFGRHGRHRGPSFQSQSSEKSRSPSQPVPQAGVFSLDTNFDDMSDIISQPPLPQTPGEVGIFTGKVAATPASELSAPA